ncbi:uncharacterized protein BDZ99DRAFT_75588 [Mytilinidion resinicola]|uniref:Uncharacterized protein n=1 Tax=Mytilinidion resinicola TaxID=574789 RepID=A0A6A6YED0_9PEZI|nr:uncharacterized protein BDZ99DRAFT_75588 [Mytilinidion resinicola]KAF2807176.1 hypothetical protein BDZ99DRAFT_75588 [Mytilinidion resinicola]
MTETVTYWIKHRHPTITHLCNLPRHPPRLPCPSPATPVVPLKHAKLRISAKPTTTISKTPPYDSHLAQQRLARRTYRRSLGLRSVAPPVLGRRVPRGGQDRIWRIAKVHARLETSLGTALTPIPVFLVVRSRSSNLGCITIA